MEALQRAVELIYFGHFELLSCFVGELGIGVQ